MLACQARANAGLPRGGGEVANAPHTHMRDYPLTHFFFCSLRWVGHHILLGPDGLVSHLARKPILRSTVNALEVAFRDEVFSAADAILGQFVPLPAWGRAWMDGWMIAGEVATESRLLALDSKMMDQGTVHRNGAKVCCGAPPGSALNILGSSLPCCCC